MADPTEREHLSPQGPIGIGAGGSSPPVTLLHLIEGRRRDPASNLASCGYPEAATEELSVPHPRHRTLVLVGFVVRASRASAVVPPTRVVLLASTARIRCSRRHSARLSDPRRLAFGRESFAVSCPLALAGNACYPASCSSARGFASRFSQRSPHGRRLVFSSGRCDQPPGGLSPPSHRACWAHTTRRRRAFAPRRLASVRVRARGPDRSATGASAPATNDGVLDLDVRVRVVDELSDVHVH
jgi:hypothetical protein